MDRTDKDAADEEGKSPPYTMKSIGERAHRLDRVLSERLSSVVVSVGGKLSGRLRRNVQSGQWQNYVFLIVVALIVIVVLTILFRR